MNRSPCARLRRLATVLTVALVAAGLRAQILPGWPVAPFPPGNPTFASSGNITDLHRELLGKNLFWDEQLSTDGTVSCGTCHDPRSGGNDKNGGVQHPGFDNLFGNADDTFGSPGVVRSDTNRDFTPAAVFGLDRQATGLNAPTMIGAAWFQRLFWDKRAGPVFQDLSGATVPGFATNAALETQASGPPANSVEMGHDGTAGLQWSQIEAKLGVLFPLALATNIPPTFAVIPGVDYQQMFDIVYGPGPITREKITIAIAAYMRTLIPDQTPFDLGTMTVDQQAGFQLFTQRGCTTCHNGPLFSDGLAHNIQLVNHNVFPPTFPNDGFGIGVKTPTLRNVGLHKRFFHSGHMTSLTQTMTAHYNHPATPIPFRFNPLLNTTTPLPPNGLTEFQQVLDFLTNALTDPRVAAGTVPFDFPTLHGENVPFGSNLVGPGSQGTGGLVPIMIGNAPAKIGNNEWRLGLGDALPGAAAALWFSPLLLPGQVIGGIPVELDLSVAFVSGTLTVQTNGTATVHQPVPLNPGLIGALLNWQWFVPDPAAVGSIAASPAATMVVF